MKLLMSIACVCLLGCSVSPLAKQGSSPTPVAPEAKNAVDTAPQALAGRMFPTYTANDLNGQPITLPTDLPSNATVVLIGFKRWHQRPIDGWLRALGPVFARYKHVDYMELPVIRKMGPTSRWFLDTAMRRGIPKRSKRARVVTLYLDKSEFRRRLGIANEDDIQVYLTRPSGEILWSASGKVSADAVRGLVAVLEANRTLARSK